jgi:putative transposase
MRANKLRAHRSHRHHYSKPDVAAPNHLQQDIVTKQPNIAWVTEITYIRTMQDQLYWSIVIDLFSRKVVGWSMKSTMNCKIAVDALLMAVNRREPTEGKSRFTRIKARNLVLMIGYGLVKTIY